MEIDSIKRFRDENILSVFLCNCVVVRCFLSFFFLRNTVVALVGHYKITICAANKYSVCSSNRFQNYDDGNNVKKKKKRKSERRRITCAREKRNFADSAEYHKTGK